MSRARLFECARGRPSSARKRTRTFASSVYWIRRAGALPRARALHAATRDNTPLARSLARSSRSSSPRGNSATRKRKTSSRTPIAKPGRKWSRILRTRFGRTRRASSSSHSDGCAWATTLAKTAARRTSPSTATSVLFQRSSSLSPSRACSSRPSSIRTPGPSDFSTSKTPTSCARGGYTSRTATCGAGRRSASCSRQSQAWSCSWRRTK